MRGPTSDRQHTPHLDAARRQAAPVPNTRTASERAVRARPIAHPNRQIVAAAWAVRARNGGEFAPFDYEENPRSQGWRTHSTSVVCHVLSKLRRLYARQHETDHRVPHRPRTDHCFDTGPGCRPAVHRAVRGPRLGRRRETGYAVAATTMVNRTQIATWARERGE